MDMVSPSRGGKLKSAVAWAFAMAWGAQGITVISSFITASLVGPKSFGTIAMAAIYVAFIQMFLEQGFSAAIVQRKNLEKAHLDSVFWMTLLLSIVLAAVSILLSGWWAHVNHLPQLARIIEVYSILIPFQGLTVVQESLLKRDMDFKSLAVRSTSSAAMGAILGVTLAFKGYGVWALVVEDIFAESMRLLLLWRLGGWRPGLRFSWRHVKDLTHFSFHVFIAQLGTFVQRRCDALLIGLFFGPVAVGIYRLADRLVVTVIEVITKPLVAVVLPHFSRFQDDLRAMKRNLLACIRSSSLVTVPSMAMLAALASLVVAALGSKWGYAAPVAQILCLVGITRAVTLFTGPLLQATNRPKYFAWMTWSLAAVNLVVFVATGFLLRNADTRAQTVGMALGRALIFCLLYTPVNLWMIMRICRITPKEMFVTLRPALLASGLVLLTGLAIVKVVQRVDMPNKAALAVAGALTAVVTGLLVLAMDSQLRDLVSGVFRRVRRQAAPPVTIAEAEVDAAISPAS